MHDPLSASTTSFQGTLYSDQAGAVFTARKHAYIGYSLISVDKTTNNYETHLRTYFDDRKAFDEAIDVVQDGRFYSSQQAREFWRKIAKPIDDKSFRSFLAGPYLNALQEDFNKAEGENSANLKFVAAPMKKYLIQSGTDGADKPVTDISVTFDQLLTSDSNCIVYASPEYGRTTLLKQLRHKLLENSETITFARMPILLEFADIKYSDASVLRLLKSRCISTPSETDVESLLKLGKICILLDDVDFADNKRMSALREFVRLFPKIRYVLSSSKSIAAPYGAHVVPEMPVNFEFVEICELRRSDMRELVMKYNTHNNVEVLLDRLQSEFQEINLPFTAANGNILMTIFEEQSGFRPINRAVLVEQFIDTSLRKAAIEQSKRETFDYANKTALLAHVAGWMAQNNNYLPNFELIRSTMKNYLENLGLNAPLDDLVREFFVARIFVRRSEDRVSFRYRAVLEYFIALKMLQDQEFKAWVIDEERYLQYPNEIQYYAGKLRNDSGLVETIHTRFLDQLDQLYADLGVEIDLEQITSLKLPGTDETSEQDSIDQLSEQLSMPPLSREERDKELETELPSDVEKRQEVFRPKVDMPGARLMVGLVLYSGVVKNMELIPDATKRRHLEFLLKGWSIFLHLSLGVVPEIARHRKVRINGVLYEINAPIGMPDSELARQIALRMPVGVSRLASASLGTEKLERQLIEPTLDSENHPLVYEFFRTALIADLRLPATADAIKTALEKLRNSKYLEEAMIWKVADLRRLDRINPNQFNLITTSLARAISDLRGGTKKQREKEASRQVNRIHKESLVLKIKKKFDDET